MMAVGTLSEYEHALLVTMVGNALAAEDEPAVARSLSQLREGIQSVAEGLQTYDTEA